MASIENTNNRIQEVCYNRSNFFNDYPQPFSYKYTVNGFNDAEQFREHFQTDQVNESAYLVPNKIKPLHSIIDDIKTDNTMPAPIEYAVGHIPKIRDVNRVTKEKTIPTNTVLRKANIINAELSNQHPKPDVTTHIYLQINGSIQTNKSISKKISCISQTELNNSYQKSDKISNQTSLKNEYIRKISNPNLKKNTKYDEIDSSYNSSYYKEFVCSSMNSNSVDCKTANEENEGERMQNRELSVKWFKKTQAKRILKGNTFPDWFHGIITRRESELLLSFVTAGSFLIRVSESRLGYTLSFKGSKKCYHYMIDQLADGNYQIIGERETHVTLHDLVLYHQKEALSNWKDILTKACPQKEKMCDYQDLLDYNYEKAVFFEHGKEN